MKKVKIAVIGGGPAGLAAAAEAKKAGESDLLILERDRQAGGILNQCIHNGFGLHTFKEELTGPEYAQRFIDQAEALQIPVKLNTMVLSIRTVKEAQEDGEDLYAAQEDGADSCAASDRTDGAADRTPMRPQDKIITCLSREEGLVEICAEAVILAMGCRERPRGALNIPGFRPAGIYSAGTAQKLVNIDGFMPGKNVVILGSGDIGLIMARRMTLEGAKVQVVAELMPYSGGLKRNIVQCLDDFGIPLKLSHTVVDIEGRDRVRAVTIAQVDDHLRPVPGTGERYECDTLLLSCGLIPENELTQGLGAQMSPVTKGPEVNESFETSAEGVFACGNVLHVHDLVDFVSQEAAQAGRCAVRYVRGELNKKASADASEEVSAIRIGTEGGVRYTVPETIRPLYIEDTQTIRFRVGAVMKDVYVSVYLNDRRVFHRKKKIVSPGEMETVILKKETFMENPGLSEITVKLEKEAE